MATAAVLGVIAFLAGRFVSIGPHSNRTDAVPAARTAEERIAQLQGALAQRPDDGLLLAQLSVAELSRFRETADPSWLSQAALVATRSVSATPNEPLAHTAAGLLALAQHDFTGALQQGRAAHDLNPQSADAYAVIVDAEVELGRYDDAAADAQRMVDRRPSLSSLARVSYIRELNGDTSGALSAMTSALTSGAGSPDDLAYVQTLLGDLQLNSGHLTEARTAYQRALHQRPDYGAAQVGLARVAAASGDLTGAATALEPVAARLPLPATVALLGDVYTALGRTADAGRQYGLVSTIEQLNRANGVAVDLEMARFFADHASDAGVDRAATVTTAADALRQRPTIYGEDALAWSLRGAGRSTDALPHARAALRLGTQDALLWWHLAAVEADVGDTAAARDHLSHALSINPYLTVRDLPQARALAARLGVA